MRKAIIILYLILSTPSIGQVDEKKLTENFMDLLNTNHSLYLINFENLKTHEIKEICIMDYDFIEAFEIEHKISFRDSVDNSDADESYFKATAYIKKNGSRNFGFENPRSLEILNSFYISDTEMQEFKKRIDVEKLVNSVKKEENWFLDINEDNYKDEIKYAFILSQFGFQIGYLQECFGSNGLFCQSCLK